MTTELPTSEIERYNNLIGELNSLDFLEIKEFASYNSEHHKKFFIQKTPYYIEICYNQYRNKITKAYLCSVPTRWSLEFEDFFESQTEDIKEKIIFHLDFFR